MPLLHRSPMTYARIAGGRLPIFTQESPATTWMVSAGNEFLRRGSLGTRWAVSFG